MRAIDFGKHADGTRIKVKSISAGWRHTCVVLEDHTARCFGSNSYGQLGLGFAGDDLDAIGKEGRRASIGDGLHEMGKWLPPIDFGLGRKVAQISAGYTHTCAVLVDGLAYCWGDGTHGRLGSHTYQRQNPSPVPILGDLGNRTVVMISAS